MLIWHFEDKSISLLLSRYVDAYRGVAVQLGGPECDLKEAIDQSGLSLFNAEPQAGAPSDTMYLKQGEHLMKKGVYPAALYYLNMALKLNQESKVRGPVELLPKWQ